MSSNTSIGLRIDVDTYRGTRLGVPRLLELLAAHDIKASFFFSVGPDNMGRHLWRLLRPAFLLKMLRSNAPGLYGWDILLRGTLWPGPIIGKKLAPIIRATATAGHEVGLHAWDHHAWQMHIERMDEAALYDEIKRGMDLLGDIIGHAPDCSAVAGWRCDERVLQQKERFAFRYNSDCRGESIFRPRLGNSLGTPQIPVTLPTYDEVIGHNGINDANYNQHILSLLRPGQLNVLTIHAEVEGIARADLFADFLRQVKARDLRCLPLGVLLPTTFNEGGITQAKQAGREGWLCVQKAA